MRMPSVSQQKSLARAQKTYASDLILADSFLTGRGLTMEMAVRWGLGVVSSPEPGHEHAVGRLAIPYYNKVGVIGFKFRCIEAHDCKAFGHDKYTSPVGQAMYLYNVLAVDTHDTIIHITEGELDAIVLSEALGQAVGIPGATNWQPHWRFHFAGFERVLAWPDGDKAGRDMAGRLRKELPTCEIVQMPAGKDVNGLFLESGTPALKKLAGIEEETLPEAAHV